MQDTTTQVKLPHADLQACPNCHAPLEKQPGYIVWCNQCDWNVKPFNSARPKNAFDTQYTKMNKQWGKRLFEEMLQTESLKPNWDAPRIAIFAVAALIHLFTLTLAVLGAWIVIAAWPYVVIVALGLIMLAVVWVIRPRVAKLPKGAYIISRDDFPALYETVDRVAEAFGARKVDTIVLDEDYNAAFGQVGWRRRRVLYLGLPLFSYLEQPGKDCSPGPRTRPRGKR